ncbi:MAG: 50S ribosomal protein L3 [bacterium]
MLKAIIGRKIRMTKAFEPDGRVVPLTAVQAGPCPIVQLKTPDTDGYSAIQVGYEVDRRKRGANQPMAGHFKKANIEPTRFLREFRTQTLEGFEVGQELTVASFEKGDRVDVAGISKGLGFAGVVTRHNFKGGGDTHGSMFHRAPGSIGASAYPSRVFKGVGMPGHMGAETVSIQNLEVYLVDAENHLLYLRGAVPGPSGGLVTVKVTTKGQKQAKAK